MKTEFKVGDVIVRIGESRKMYVYAVQDGFYYVASLTSGSAYVFPCGECEGNYVVVDWITEDQASEATSTPGAVEEPLETRTALNLHEPCGQQGT